jgi:protein SCO1
VNPRLLIALVLAGAFVVAAGILAAGRGDTQATSATLRFEGATLPEGVRAPELRGVRTQDDERLTMRSLRGRPVIVTFLYTTCEDSCPTQAQQIKGALNELGERVPVLAIAVDPPRDDRRRARAFLAGQRMTGRMDFVLGTRSQLRRATSCNHSATTWSTPHGSWWWIRRASSA